MARILSIETSSAVCSVAVHENGYLIGCNEVVVSNSHSEVLTCLIESLLQNLGLRLSQLDAICVGKGPGSYTGLRIGASTAKGLCYSLDLPLIAIDTLAGIASPVISVIEDSSALFCPMLDARRMEVYCAIYRYDGSIVEDTNPMIFEEGALSEYEKSVLYFFGDGAKKGLEFMNRYSKAIFIDDINATARGLGMMAYQYFLNGEFESIPSFEPFYLKEARITTSKKKYV
jgi:tRNA threonylcarbamoyladenosine biosynthesis protein TsaB